MPESGESNQNALLIANLQHSTMCLSGLSAGLGYFATKLIAHVRDGSKLQASDLEIIKKSVFAENKSCTVKGLNEHKTGIVLKDIDRLLRVFIDDAVRRACIQPGDVDQRATG